MNVINKITTIAITSLLVTGCVTKPPLRVVITTSPLDSVKTLKALEKGTSAIKGSALLRQRGGVVVTCAGMEVGLVPVTAYSVERFTALYGSERGGYRPANALGIKFEPDNEAVYQSLTRETRCDAQGYFKFDNVAQGDYFVVTSVTWRATATQGGWISQRVSLTEAETKEIVLTSN